MDRVTRTRPRWQSISHRWRELVQHLYGTVAIRGGDLPNRVDLRAGWTLDFADAQGAEGPMEFTYMENLQTIAGQRELLLWKTESE